MKTFFDCIPCLIRQSLASVRLVTPDERIHEQILREVLEMTSQMDLSQPPAAMSQIVHRRIRHLCDKGEVVAVRLPTGWVPRPAQNTIHDNCHA